MAFPSVLDLAKAGGVGTRRFNRNRQGDRTSSYTNVYSLVDPLVIRDTIDVRASEKGSPKDPSTMQRRHNLNRVYSRMGGDNKVYTITVNLSVVLPGGNVIDGSMIEDIVHDICVLASNLESVDDAADMNAAVSAAYILAVQTLDT